MSETSSNDLGIWVDDYTTSAGVHVAGHWRKRGGRGISDPGEPAPIGETATGGPTYASVKDRSHTNPTGGTNVIATNQMDISKTSTTSGHGIPTARASDATETPRDKVAAGLEALRRRRESLSQRDAAGGQPTTREASQEPDAGTRDASTGHAAGSGGVGHVDTNDAGQQKCNTCGQFKATHHACRASEGTVVDPAAAVAARRATDRFADTLVTEYVPFSGQTCWSAKGPNGTYLVTPVESTLRRHSGYLVWRSDAAHDGVVIPTLDTGINMAARLASNLPTGRPGNAEWASAVQYNLERLPDGGTHTIPPLDGRDGVRYAEAIEITNHQSDDSGSFTITSRDGVIARETYGPGHYDPVRNNKDKARAAQMATYQAGARQDPARCGACGQYVPLERAHSCPNPNGTRAAAAVRQLADATVDHEVDELEDSKTADDIDLPATNYRELEGDDRTHALLADLDVAVKKIVDSGQLTAWMNAMASNGMSRWSFNNRILAMLQMFQRRGHIDGLHMMGFKDWKKHNRSVNKGAEAVYILAPRKRTITEEDENGDERKRTIVTGFKYVAVFDISDTNGEPLAESPAGPSTGRGRPPLSTAARWGQEGDPTSSCRSSARAGS